MSTHTKISRIYFSPISLGERGQRYCAIHDGVTLIESSRNAEFDAARALLAKGITGPLEVWHNGVAKTRNPWSSASPSQSLTCRSASSPCVALALVAAQIANGVPSTMVGAAITAAYQPVPRRQEVAGASAKRSVGAGQSGKLWARTNLVAQYAQARARIMGSYSMG